MYLLRVQAIADGQPLLLKYVSVFASDGVTLVPLFDPATETPINTLIKTDASGFIRFKIANLQTLTFKILQGASLSAIAYPLYSSANPDPDAQVDEVLSLPCGEMIVQGYGVKTNNLNQLLRCSATNIADVNKLVGIARQTGNIGDVITIVEDEVMDNTAWTWEAQKPIFLGNDGTLTQSLTGLAFIQRVGVAVTATKMVIRISQPILRV